MAEPLVTDHAHGAAVPDFVDDVQDLLSRDLPKAPEIGPQDCMAFELAVVEVVTNAVQHTEATHKTAVELDFELEIRPSLMLARLYEIGAEPFDMPESDTMPSHEQSRDAAWPWRASCSPLSPANAAARPTSGPSRASRATLTGRPATDPAGPERPRLVRFTVRYASREVTSYDQKVTRARELKAQRLMPALGEIARGGRPLHIGRRTTAQARARRSTVCGSVIPSDSVRGPQNPGVVPKTRAAWAEGVQVRLRRPGCGRSSRHDVPASHGRDRHGCGGEARGREPD